MKNTKMIATVAAACIFLLGLIITLSSNDNTSNENLVQTIIVREDINSLTEITADMVKVKEIHNEAVPENSVSNVDEVVGKVAMVDMFRGDIITTQKIEESGSIRAGLSSVVPEEMRAITINVEQDSGVAGLLKIGDQVDVISVLGEEETAVLLLENRKVLAVDNLMNPPAVESEQGMQYVTVTLAVTPEEALDLSLATTVANDNRLILRNQADEEKQGIDGVILEDIKK
ncbi:Flp pilus assembly protein CpaB [Proteinivorax tanatarense]|uniref:Flp pilus assembly protein CpaB n=1 Tax=Proteinivorax tanatarense TaxID=1260629 RepID=A0AAU7VKD5_9FIRM